jgi:cytochrome P450
VPTNIRYAKKHTSLPHGGGHDGSLPIFVAKGTVVHYSIWTMHRSSTIYGKDPEAFRPERWLSENNGKPLRPGWGFLAFSGGPRTCIGQHKALTEAAYVVVRMLQTYGGIEARDEQPWREHMGLVLSSYHGVKIALSN